MKVADRHVVRKAGLRRRERAVAGSSQLFMAWWDEHSQAIDDRQDDDGEDVAEDNG